MPAVLEASKLGSKAAKAGFDWPDAGGLLEKLAEETEEVRAEIGGSNQDALELEVGDLLFTAVNLARHLQIDPENALRRTNAKFRQRYAAMEQEAGGSDSFESMNNDQKEALWRRAKEAQPGDRAVQMHAGQEP